MLPISFESVEDKEIWLDRAAATLVVVVLIAGILFGLSARFNLSFNKTASLNYSLFITDRSGTAKERGQYVKFQLSQNTYFAPSHWTKRIAGIPGDTITVKNREVFINGNSVGFAKEISASNTAYFPIEEGVIPPHKYFLQADHPDSYDSRYKSFGLIDDSTFIGREYPVF